MRVVLHDALDEFDRRGEEGYAEAHHGPVLKTVRSRVDLLAAESAVELVDGEDG